MRAFHRRPQSLSVICCSRKARIERKQMNTLRTIPEERPKLTDEDKRSLMVVVQSKNRKMDDGTMMFQDFSTIRTDDDMIYACQMVEGVHRQFNVEARIVRGREVIYARAKEDTTPDVVIDNQIVEIREVQRDAQLGERVKFWWNGSAYFGRVTKINQKTYRVTDEKFGTDTIYQVVKSICVVIEGV